jgi:hypothetical protein
MKKTTFIEIILVFLIVLIAYGFFSPNAFTYPNGTSYLILDWNVDSRLSLVKAFVEDGDFEIDKYHETDYLRTGDKAYFNGHYYSDKPIGSALLGIEFYSLVRFISNAFGYQVDFIVFEELVTFLAISLICAFLAPLVYSFVKTASDNTEYSLLIALAICLGTPLFFYSTVYYGHSLAGLFLFAAFFLWFNMKSAGQISLVKAFISAYFLGFAFITEYTSSLIIFLSGLYILYVIWKQNELFRPRIYASLALGFVLPFSVALLYNQAIFQNLFSTGYQYEALSQFSENQSTGVMGIGLPDLKVLFYMTFHTTMGIFWQSPILLLAFVGWAMMWRNSLYRAEAVFSFGTILLYFVTLSGYYQWWGGTAFTPRFIIPALPFFAIPLAFLPRKTHIVALVLTMISVAQMLIVTASSVVGLAKITNVISSDKYYPMFQNVTIYDVYFRNFLANKLTPNRGYELFGLVHMKSLLPLLITETTLLGFFILAVSTRFAPFRNKLVSGLKKTG